MRQKSVERIVEALQAREVRYPIVGGRAVVAHGHALHRGRGPRPRPASGRTSNGLWRRWPSSATRPARPCPWRISPARRTGGDGRPLDLEDVRRLSLAEKLRWLEEAQELAGRSTDRRTPDAVREPGPPAGKERPDDDAER